MAAGYSTGPNLQVIGYSEGRFLGRGGEGFVYSFKYCGSEQRGCVTPGQLVAIKFTPAGNIRRNEVLVQARIDHSGIVKVLDVNRYHDPQLGPCLLTVFELANPMPVLAPGTSIGSCIEATVAANMSSCVFTSRPGAVPVIPLWQVTRPPALFPANGDAAPASVAQAEPDLRWIIAQVAVALDFLHQHPLRVCHRDVKAENVLITAFTPHADGVPRPEVKVADFGFSKAMCHNGIPPPGAAGGAAQYKVTTRLGTACYVAPEICGLGKDDSYCGMKADVWSLGILMCVLVTGLQPFLLHPRDDRRHIMQRARDPQHVLRVLGSVRSGGASGDLCALLQCMLSVDPAERCTMHEVLHSPWMSRLNSDIRNPHAASHPQLPEFLPVWDALTASQRARAREIHAAYNAHAAAHGPAAGCPCGGWTLPHLPHAAVETLLEDVRGQGLQYG